MKPISSALASIALITSTGIGFNILTLPSISPAQAQSAGQGVQTLRGCFLNSPFTAKIAFNPTNIRQSPSTSAAIVGRFTQIGQVVNFSGINTGTAVPDAWDGVPDNMWDRLADGRGWTAGAVVSGYPIRGNCSNPPVSTGNAQQIINAVDRVNPDINYRADANWTYCNWFVADVLKVLNVAIPRVGQYAYSDYNSPIFGMQRKPLLAEDLYAFFQAGGNGQWRKVDAATAVARANQGSVVVAAIGVPPGGSDGHIAIVVPGGSGSNVYVAQAGRINSKKISVTQGFGGRTPGYFEYTGPR